MLKIVGIVLLVVGVVALVFGVIDLYHYVHGGRFGQSVSKIGSSLAGKMSPVTKLVLELAVGVVCVGAGFSLYKRS